MNEPRRKNLRKVIKALRGMKDETLCPLNELLEDTANEEEETRDSLPENLQGSERYEDSEKASEFMEDAISAMSDMMDNIDSVIEALESIPKV
jgi:hypothetical protein